MRAPVSPSVSRSIRSRSPRGADACRQRFFESRRKVRISASELGEEGLRSRIDGGNQGASIEIAHDAREEGVAFARRQVVDVFELVRVMTVALGSQRKGPVAYPLQIEERLPQPAAVGRRTGMQHVVPGEAGFAEPVRNYRPRLRVTGRVCCRPSPVEEHPCRAGPYREIIGRRETDIQCQTIRHQEAEDEGGTKGHLVAMGRVELPLTEVDPVSGHLRAGVFVGDHEGDIDIRPPVRLPGAERPGEERRVETRILPCEIHDSRQDTFPIRWCEHRSSKFPATHGSTASDPRPRNDSDPAVRTHTGPLGHVRARIGATPVVATSPRSEATT